MSKSNVMLLMMKGVISEMSAEEQARVEECKGMLRAIVQDHGDCGVLAFSILALELDAEVGK